VFIADEIQPGARYVVQIGGNWQAANAQYAVRFMYHQTPVGDGEAHHRALGLLEEFLTPQQHRSFEEAGYFEVTSEGGRHYRLDVDNMVYPLDGPMKGQSLCIQMYDYPLGDALLGRKLLLETDESMFIQIAYGGDHETRWRVLNEIERERSLRKGLPPRPRHWAEHWLSYVPGYYHPNPQPDRPDVLPPGRYRLR